MTVHQHYTADGGIWLAMNNWAIAGGFTLAEAEGVTAYRLPGKVTALEGAVEEAIRKDREESWKLGDELDALWRDGIFGYWTGRKDFEAQGESRITDFKNRMADVRALVEGVVEAVGQVPLSLERDARAWGTAADEVAGIQRRIAAVKSIPGWTGGASGGYTQRSIVQDSATQELHGMATSLSRAINQMALFNRALFLFMDRELEDAAAEVGNLPGTSGGMHYRRASRGATLLEILLLSLSDAQSGQPVKAAAEDLQDRVTKCLDSPQLLAPGAWPTGGGQADVPPAPTDQVPDVDEDTRVHDGPSAGTTHEDSGVERSG